MTKLKTDPTTISLQHKQLIRETLAGYAAANEVTKREKREWLQGMTPAESWETFEELVAFSIQLRGERTSLQVFEKRRIDELLNIRQIFDKAAIAQGYS